MERLPEAGASAAAAEEAALSGSSFTFLDVKPLIVAEERLAAHPYPLVILFHAAEGSNDSADFEGIATAETDSARPASEFAPDTDALRAGLFFRETE